MQKEIALKSKGSLGRRPDYHTTRFVYYAMRAIIDVLMRIVFRYRAVGRERVPRQGPIIIAVNHLHIIDPCAVVGAVSRQIVTLAADKWLNSGFVRWFLQSAGSIFVNRGEVDRTALRQCLDVLKSGMALAIAPEGTRSPTGQLQRGKPGIAYIAHHSNATIVPIASWGQEHLADWKRLHRPTCNVVVGDPVRFDYGDGRLSSARLQELADALMVQIARLLPPEYRGCYAERAGALAPDELPAGILRA